MARLWLAAGYAHAGMLAVLPWCLRGGLEATAVAVAVLGVLTVLLTRGSCRELV